MDNLDNLDREWLLINSTKEALSLAKRKPTTTYNEAIAFAKEIAPEIFEGSKTDFGRKTKLEKLYQKYKEEADALSHESTRQVGPEDLMKSRLRELEGLISRSPQDLEQLRRESIDLKDALEKPQKKTDNFENVTEDEAIRNDVNVAHATNSFIKNYLGKYYVYYDKKKNSVFQIAVFHPGPKEAITGADLIYEQYDSEGEKVRIAALQYKIWDGQTLYFSAAKNLDQQLKRLENCFCSQGMCKGKRVQSNFFRFPYCAAFIKPTDKLQSTKNLVTSGHHIPICSIEKVKDKGYKDDVIYRGSLEKESLNTESFEMLFNAERVGSRWLKKSELEAFYKKNKVLEQNDKLIVHGQSMKVDHFDNLF